MVARPVDFDFPYIFMPRGCNVFVELMSLFFWGFQINSFWVGGYVSQRFLGATLKHIKIIIYKMKFYSSCVV